MTVGSEQYPFVVAGLLQQLGECQTHAGWDGAFAVQVQMEDLPKVESLAFVASALADLADLEGHRFDMSFVLERRSAGLVVVVAAAVVVEAEAEVVEVDQALVFVPEQVALLARSLPSSAVAGLLVLPDSAGMAFPVEIAPSASVDRWALRQIPLD